MPDGLVQGPSGLLQHVPNMRAADLRRTDFDQAYADRLFTGSMVHTQIA